MDNGLKNEIKRCLCEGKRDEEKVALLIENCCGGKCTVASKYDDTRRHVDLWWDSPKNGKLGVDVKGIKRNARSDANKDDTIHWIEIVNVNGQKGWIYGEMDYIAFLTEHTVFFVRPYDLYGHILINTVGKELSTTMPNGFYLPYRRNGRKDIIIKMPVSDLSGISHFKINY